MPPKPGEPSSWESPQMRSKPATWAVSLLGGVVIAWGLLLSIHLLARYQSQAKADPPLLVVELTHWPTPAPAPMPPDTPPEPAKQDVQKTAPKPPPELAPVAKEIVKEKTPQPAPPEPEETYIEPLETPVLAQSPMTSVDASEEVLPTPVPTFRLTETVRFLHRETPIYPEEMRTQGISGVVKLEALIDKEGRVRQVRILTSAGEPFDDAARRAIFASSFYPARVNSQPVAVLLRLPVKFSLL